MISAFLVLGGAVSIFLTGWWMRGKVEAGKLSRMFQRSAEEVAAANIRVEEAARQTSENVESVGADTPTSVGNELLSGGSLSEARKATADKKATS